jgi:aspartate/methionine/tyrosine aminotransferase
MICAPHLSQIAAQFAVENLGPWRREKRALMAGRIEAFRASVKAAVRTWKIGSIGAFLAYMRHPFGSMTSMEAARLLAKEENLLCIPGGAFGPDQEGYLRLAFASVEASLMPEIARRLAHIESRTVEG